MCVIFFYANSNPMPGGYKLIIASNRDEFYGRPTLPAAKWSNAEHVYGGIDMEPGREGGTWLAISGQNGVFKVGALLNLTGEPKPRDAIAHNNILLAKNCQNNNKTTCNHNGTSSTSTATTIHNHFLLGRGMIVSDYVQPGAEQINIEQYNQSLVDDCLKYSAFNFIAIEIGDRTIPARISVCSNSPPTVDYYVEGKCYGFGNSLPAVPFQKVIYGQKCFAKIIEEHNVTTPDENNCASNKEKLIQKLLDMLKHKEKFWPDDELQRRAPSWGHDLSAINVMIPQFAYGSRTHSVIIVDDKNKMYFCEETMMSDNPSHDWAQTHIEKQFVF